MDHVYNFHIKLNVPDSNTNQGLGNFMIRMDLYSQGQVVASEKRPVKLKYRSELLRNLYTLWKLPSLLADLDVESHQVFLPLIENYSPKTQVDQIQVTLSNAQVQVYSSFVTVTTHFDGLAYFMYNWWFSTGVLMISFIMLGETVALSYCWSFLTTVLSESPDTSTVNEEIKSVKLFEKPRHPGFEPSAVYKPDDEPIYPSEPFGSFNRPMDSSFRAADVTYNSSRPGLSSSFHQGGLSSSFDQFNQTKLSTSLGRAQDSSFRAKGFDYSYKGDPGIKMGQEDDNNVPDVDLFSFNPTSVFEPNHDNMISQGQSFSFPYSRKSLLAQEMASLSPEPLVELDDLNVEEVEGKSSD